MGHTVAVKELLLHDSHLQQAFEEEARRLAPLRHPVLPNVSDHFTEDQGQYLVMEYISGNDLGELIKRRGSPFEVKWIIKWADQLLGALDYLHTRQPAIIHRDIKPSNLKLTLEGNIIVRPTSQPVRAASQPVSPPQTKPWLMQAFAIALVVGVLLFVAVGISILSGGGSTPAPTEASAPFSSHTRAKDDMTIVYVPAGSFQMGSDNSDSQANDDEKPAHRVTLSAFWIDQTEVTNEQFAAFLNERGNQEEGGVTLPISTASHRLTGSPRVKFVQ